MGLIDTGMQWCVRRIHKPSFINGCIPSYHVVQYYFNTGHITLCPPRALFLQCRNSQSIIYCMINISPLYICSSVGTPPVFVIGQPRRAWNTYSLIMRARSWLPPSLSLLLCGVVRADGEDGDLRPRYVFDTDASKPGNCATYLDSLQKSYSEAADAANAAIEAINDLQQKMPEAWEPQDRQQWVRKADMFAAMFGIPVDKSTGLQLSNDLVTRVHCKR